MAEAESLLKVDGVSKTFGGRRPLETLRDVNLHVDRGEFVSLVGPSGCGKSTLFSLVAGVESLSTGRITVDNQTDPDRRRLSVGYMFQKDLLFPWRSLLDNAALGLEVRIGRSAARERARSLLPRFGLQSFEQHRPAELSGGMRQRAALLRTLLLERPLLLLDEPFAALDALTRRELQTWLRETWTTGSQGALLVTHDVREAIVLSDRVYVMSPLPGTIVEEVDVRPGGVEPDATQRAALEDRILRTLHLERVAP
jgi:ABC-type nitrate/sulfonate/bicarbonate transport system ATPase subunit